MKMEMTIDEKDTLLAHVIHEHFVTQKENPICVPVEHIKAKGWDLSDSNNSLWRLKEKGVLKHYKHCWGFFEIKKGKKVFIVTSEEEPKTDDDFEAYRIEVIPSRLSQAAKNSSGGTKNKDASVIYLDKNGDLYREPKKTFCYPMSGKGIPLKILKHFAENPNIDFEENTETIATRLGMDTEQLRKEIGKLRRNVENSLKLGKGFGLIESRQNSGYRLNPNLEIIVNL